MKIAFYAPMKPPDHPVPSGDRTMARLLVRALETAGHEVRLACRLRSRDPRGEPSRQVVENALRWGVVSTGSSLRRHRSPALAALSPLCNLASLAGCAAGLAARRRR